MRLVRLGPHMSISLRSPRHYPQPRSFSTLAERHRARTRPSIEHLASSRACSRRAWGHAAAAGSPYPSRAAALPPPAASRRLGPPSRAELGAARRRRGGKRTSGASTTTARPRRQAGARNTAAGGVPAGDACRRRRRGGRGRMRAPGFWCLELCSWRSRPCFKLRCSYCFSTRPSYGIGMVTKIRPIPDTCF